MEHFAGPGLRQQSPLLHLQEEEASENRQGPVMVRWGLELPVLVMSRAAGLASCRRGWLWMRPRQWRGRFVLIIIERGFALSPKSHANNRILTKVIMRMVCPVRLAESESSPANKGTWADLP